MMRACFLPAVLLLGLLGEAGQVAAVLRDPPVAIRRERPRFVIDAGAFWRGDTAWVAVDVGVPYRELMFRLVGETYRADFDLIVVLYDRDRQVTGDLWNEVVTTESYAETRGSEKSFRRTVRLPAGPGRLRVEVTVSEQDSGNEGRLAQEIEIPDLRKERLFLGKIWFGGCPDDTLPSGVAHPPEAVLSRRFGTASGPVCAWSNIYVGASEPPSPIRTHWSILEDNGDVAFEGDLLLTEPGLRITVPLPIDKLWLGRYELLLRAKMGKLASERTIGFEMDESTVSLRENPGESIELVRYIAEGREIEELENADPEDRAEVWDAFWKRRDPTPETAENEYKIEFFRRVRHANEHFGGITPGWRSDRGMIYIRYGEPDLLESYPHNIDGPPYEIWIYNSLGRRFVFVDYDGFGRYELETPGRR